MIEGSDRLFINSTMIPIDVAASEPDGATEELDDGQVRMLLGRLSRQKTLEEVDGTTLIAGLNGGSSLVLAQLDAAVAGGEGVMGLRERIKHLVRPSQHPEMEAIAKAVSGLAAVAGRDIPAPVVNNYVAAPEQKAPVINVAPAEIPATVVNVAPAEVTMPAPVVNVPPTQVVVNEQRPRRKTLRHDEQGQLVEVVEHDT
jgi:hypothetical protein